MTVQDTVMLRDLNENVTALASQVDQLSGVVQDTVLHRLTEVETELMGESNA
jgi:Mor family transcriptional regulator